MALVPREDIRQTDMPVEEAVRFLVSGGVALPEEMQATHANVEGNV